MASRPCCSKCLHRVVGKRGWGGENGMRNVWKKCLKCGKTHDVREDVCDYCGCWLDEAEIVEEE
ncbi:MAG: hypothetical protein QW420_02890 [Candidatus Caldarchaeum sp.]